MFNSIKNGHGATAVPKIKGAGIANRHANKRQLAALAAAILAGDADFKPSMRQLAQLFGVSVAYVGSPSISPLRSARRSSPVKIRPASAPC